MLYLEAKKTIKLALPIIFGELAQMALHIIDAVMVGAVGYKHLAAAALVFSVINVPFVIGIGLTMSVSQMVSLANGKDSPALVSHYFFNGFWMCAFFALVISLPLAFGTDILSHLKQDAEVVAFAKPFMFLMSLSMIPMLLFMTLKQFTDGLEFTRLAMILSVVSLPINLFINWLLIYGNWGFPRLELTGAGWGTLATRILIFIALGVIIFRMPVFKKYLSLRGEQWKFRVATLRELLYIGIPSGLQMGLEIGAFAASSILIGMIGAVSLAAHQIAISCAALTFMVSIGLAQGGSIRASNNFGRGDWLTISRIGKSTLLTSLIYGVCCAIGFTLFRKSIPAAFNDEAAVISLAGVLLLFAAIFQISDTTQAIAAGLLRGIKDVRVPTLLIGISYWVVGLPTGYLLAFNFGLGAVGIWIGFIVGLTFASVFLAIRFSRMVKRNTSSA